MSHQPYPPQQPGWGPPQQPGGGARPPRPPKKKTPPAVIAVAVVGIIGFWVIVGTAISSPDDTSKSATNSAPPKDKAEKKATDSSKLDEPASFACDDFAAGYKAAQTQSARIDLANKVNEWAQMSNTDGIANNATALARGSESTDGAWQLGADSFAKACLDAGWKD